MTIRYAGAEDFPVLRRYDRHVPAEALRDGIAAKRVLAAFRGESLAGWLRYNLFWDNTPFINMLYCLEDCRGQGHGGRLLRYWEAEMEKAGFRQVLTSTLSNEQAQFFYRKHGYADCGALLLPGEPLEIILRKDLAGCGAAHGPA